MLSDLGEQSTESVASDDPRGPWAFCGFTPGSILCCWLCPLLGTVEGGPLTSRRRLFYAGLAQNRKQALVSEQALSLRRKRAGGCLVDMVPGPPSGYSATGSSTFWKCCTSLKTLSLPPCHSNSSSLQALQTLFPLLLEGMWEPCVCSYRVAVFLSTLALRLPWLRDVVSFFFLTLESSVVSFILYRSKSSWSKACFSYIIAFVHVTLMRGRSQKWGSVLHFREKFVTVGS